MDEIAIPEVYNDESLKLAGGHSHTDYILMERFDGVGISELETDAEREQVFSTVDKYAGANVYADVSYLHADMHPGNIICMKRDEKLVVPDRRSRQTEGHGRGERVKSERRRREDVGGARVSRRRHRSRVGDARR